jgi:outer membrane protein
MGGLAALALLVAPAAAQGSRDTLRDAAEAALGGNPSLQGQRALRKVADEALVQATSALRPQVGLSSSFGAERTEVGQTFSFMGMSFPRDGAQSRASLGLEARQTLYSGGVIAAQQRQARAGIEASAGRLRAFEQALLTDVVTIFMDVRRAEEEVRIRMANVASLGEQVRAARDRFEVGEVTRTDVAQAEARFAGAEAGVAAARARLDSARAVYQQLVGRPPVQLAEPPALPGLPAGLEAALARARAVNPELLAARAAADAAGEGVAAAQGELRPKLALSAAAGLQETYNDDTFRDANVGLTAQLSIPIYTGGLAASKTREARLRADQARFDVYAVLHAVEARTTASWHTLVASRQAIAASQARVAAAETALAGAQEELAVGTRITLDVLDQESELLEARLGLVDAQRSEYVAAHELLAAMGELSLESIGR